AAGGGSLLRFDGQRLLVGPESAGAQPGPAAYGCGGPATLTDANLLLGRLPPLALPPVFGPSGDQPADLTAAQRVFAELAAQMDPVAPGISPEGVASGALRIAIERMAAAIRRVSIQRGHDIRGALLVCFGGAGGQHACRLAEQLGISRVLLHPLAGVLSAYGIGMAQQRVLLERAPRQPLTAALLPELERLQADLQCQARAALERSGDLRGSELLAQVRLELRSAGSDRGLEVSWQRGAGAADAITLISQLQKAFASRHQQLYGYAPLLGQEPLVVERLLVELIATPVAAPPAATSPGAETLEPQMPLLPEYSSLWLQQPGTWQSVPLHQRSALTPGQLLQGPSLVLDATSALVLEPHWQARVLPAGELLLEFNVMARDGMNSTVRQAATAEAERDGSLQVDPTTLELYNHRFAAIAEQMGVRLQQSARSVNIRERLDFSCALFDQQGRLVANAPHIPVHLGSMGESVGALLAAIARGKRPPLAPGDVVLSNDPYGGGTHLPDITAITPVFAPQETTQDSSTAQLPIAFVACRGHHADVGGITPGSMPAFSTDIEQEGLLLRNVLFLHRDQLDEPFWRRRLNEGRYPVRNVDQLLADLQAQSAANRLGADQLSQLVQRHGLPQVQSYMAHVQAHAAEAVRASLDRLRGGDAVITLDDGSRIAVAVTIDQQRRRARIDCSGTSPQHLGNFNAPLAISKAVVLYVFRCLVGEAIPLNAGCFEPLELVVPEGCLLNPSPPAAVVAGNVETSQALANALLLALGVQAGAQGTMNNLSFGSAACQYYETICGGSGAGITPAGVAYGRTSAVQCHMTNSRLTDAEVLEERFPVRLERFAIRHGSGGAGRCPGGDGVMRALRLLEPMTVSLLSGCRQVPPPGLAGGEPGACGRNRVELPGGEISELPGCCALDLPAGSLLSIETPGGGGFGALP
ncbi:MAG: 5-oxoprolinase, partial [Cyanobacteria bacterium K_DeepCast_35m_m2_023]|nr:5-oxoprolinase [Cyanobacteria bacterium K_DeepCast_35m_m2_023]